MYWARPSACGSVASDPDVDSCHGVVADLGQMRPQLGQIASGLVHHAGVGHLGDLQQWLDAPLERDERQHLVAFDQRGAAGRGQRLHGGDAGDDLDPQISNLLAHR